MPSDLEGLRHRPRTSQIILNQLDHCHLTSQVVVLRLAALSKAATSMSRKVRRKLSGTIVLFLLLSPLIRKHLIKREELFHSK